MQVSKSGGCPFQQNKLRTPPDPPLKKTEGSCPFGFDRFSKSQPQSRFGPSMPIIDGQAQIPSFGTVLKNLVFPHKPAELPPLKRSEIGLQSEGPKGGLVQAGNLWPHETIHPLFPEFRSLSGAEKANSISHYAHASRKTGELDPLGQFGITASPQLIVDPNGMRWPFEADAQVAAARPREKNMHGRGSWGEIKIIPNPDPKKRLPYGVLNSGGIGDFRMSLGADQSTNVVGAALGVPLSANDQDVESANFLMLSGPGPQLDDLDYFAKPLTTVAIPDQNTPTLFKVLDHGFKVSAESGVRPGNHMFRFEQDGAYRENVEIPAEVQLVPNPQLTLHKLAGLDTQGVDGVRGDAVRENYSNVKVQHQDQELQVLDLALSEVLVKSTPKLAIGSKLSVSVLDSQGQALTVDGKVAEQTKQGTRIEFLEAKQDASMAIYQSLDLIWELGRRIQPGDHLYQIDVKMESGKWKKDVARVQAQSEFFPNEFADHQRLYAHTERPNKTPILRKMLKGVRWATGNIAEAIGFQAWTV